MSAIWGIVDLGKNLLEASFAEKMEKPFHKYKIDRYQTKTHENVMMGCGLQLITKESAHEILPIFDFERRIYMTADCILDNRSELIKELKTVINCDENTPDGTLIYGSYINWGEDCAKHLRGVFSFAIYDENESKLLVYADQVFQRCIYYYFDNQYAYFSTLLAPIVASGGHFKINDEFMCDSLSVFGLRASIEATYTPYEGIKKIEAGCYIKITQKGSLSIRYWSPKDSANIPSYESPKKSAEHMKHLLEEAVEDAIRCNGSVGATLSSGLDSASVCGIAATKLKGKSQPLNTYTFVPVSDYIYSRADLMTPDETEGVQLIASMHDNISPHFLDNNGIDAFKELEYFVELLEIPFKAIANIPSINNIYRHAHADGCKIILTGQLGNVTISPGTHYDALYEKFSKLKFIQAYKIINDLNKRYHISRKHLVMDCFKRFSLYPLDKMKYRLSRNLLDKTYVNLTFAKRMDVIDKLKKLKLNTTAPSYSDIDSYHKYVYEMYPLSQIGELNTKLSLVNGVIVRDPTKDIRIIEYSATLPMECFFNDGLERWLIRGNMMEYVPQEILLNVYNRGLQSADFLYRINKRWSEIMPELQQLCFNPSIESYINAAKVEEFFNTYKDGFDKHNEYIIDPLLYIATIALFMNNTNQESLK